MRDVRFGAIRVSNGAAPIQRRRSSCIPIDAEFVVMLAGPESVRPAVPIEFGRRCGCALIRLGGPAVDIGGLDDPALPLGARGSGCGTP
jgi:hypothetical protein